MRPLSLPRSRYALQSWRSFLRAKADGVALLCGNTDFGLLPKNAQLRQIRNFNNGMFNGQRGLQEVDFLHLYASSPDNVESCASTEEDYTRQDNEMARYVKFAFPS
ncbi:hypothetical protein Zmor_008222 [Zophobas morio]|uniref:Uncharacterized protein n=1 Tax=Zophobas morio TaxID=2755281 RepID=A0AA38IXE3_9CUCU|nr:hypothetical protein Zmor_008222 [Zophobas morio]